MSFAFCHQEQEYDKPLCLRAHVTAITQSINYPVIFRNFHPNKHHNTPTLKLHNFHPNNNPKSVTGERKGSRDRKLVGQSSQK